MAFAFTIIKKYYLVRHAEKQDPNNADTPISVAGQKRAVALKKVLETKHIQNIIVSQFIRTQQTAKPLADTLHISPAVIANTNITEAMNRLAHFSNSLLVGHTDNVPAIIKKITGRTVTINEDDYDNLFIITIKKNLFFTTRNLTRTTYGATSP
jgi:phosphohistidine phosphatase SixA